MTQNTAAIDRRNVTATHPVWCDLDDCTVDQDGAGIAKFHYGRVASIPLDTFDNFGDPQYVEVYREQEIDAPAPSVRVTVSGNDCGLAMTRERALDLATMLVNLAP